MKFSPGSHPPVSSAPGTRRPPGSGRRVRRALVPIALLVALLALVAQQVHLILRYAPASYSSWAVPASRSSTVDLGVTTDPLARNWWRPWQPRDLQTVNKFEQAAHQHASVVMWYADWQHGRLSTAQLDAVARRGSVPEITWEPWDASKGLWKRQPDYTLRNIIDGKFDPYIRSWADGLAAWGKPVRLRFAQEMNGNWFPWSEAAEGNHPGEFVQAWRDVHHIFDLAGATNVQWVWSPVSGAPRAAFPGADEVDVLGVTCLNGGRTAFRAGWRSFAAICGKSVNRLHALAPALPIELSEVASADAGGNRAAWIAGMFRFLARHPEVKSMIWFNLHKETDWTIDGSSPAERQFAGGARSGRFR
jgi:beta-mannanase